MTAITAQTVATSVTRARGGDERQLPAAPRGVDLLLVRAGRALEQWGAHRAGRAARVAVTTRAYVESRATATALAHAGLLPR